MENVIKYILLEENETNKHEEKEEMSIQCDNCGCWFHVICENMDINTITKDTNWNCSICLCSLSDYIQ